MAHAEELNVDQRRKERVLEEHCAKDDTEKNKDFCVGDYPHCRVIVG